MHVATHTLCGWNCDNITTVLDGTRKRTYIQQQLTESSTKDTIQRSKDQRKLVASGYGQDTNWTKSPEDKRGTISLPRPSLAGGIPKLTSSDFKPVGCIGMASPKGSVLVEVLASNTHKISKLEFWGNRLAIEAATNSNNNL